MTPAQTPPWRGSLLPLGCAAAAKPDNAVCLGKMQGPATQASRSKPPPPQGLVSSRISSPTPPTVGAGLLAKAAAQLASVLNVSPRASPPHPTRGVHKYCIQPNSPVGASLLAKAAGQLASILNVPPSSRASSHTLGGGEHSICNSPDPPVGASLLAMKTTRSQSQTTRPHRQKASLLQPPPTPLYQATHPCASAYNYARIRPLVRLVPGFYCLSCHCPSVVGFSSPR